MSRTGRAAAEFVLADDERKASRERAAGRAERHLAPDSGVAEFIRLPPTPTRSPRSWPPPPRHAQLFAEAIPGAQLQLHPGHGHFSILGAAREMLAALAE